MFSSTHSTDSPLAACNDAIASTATWLPQDHGTAITGPRIGMVFAHPGRIQVRRAELRV